jgi:hypothetical protein
VGDVSGSPTGHSGSYQCKHLQRGTKPKSTGALLSDSDSDSEEDSAPPKPQSKAPHKVPPAKETSSARVKRGIIFSSDEDDEEEPAPKKRLQKGKAKRVGASTEDDDETERSLRAMMDIDDGMFYLFYPTFHFPLYFFNGGVQNIIFTYAQTVYRLSNTHTTQPTIHHEPIHHLRFSSRRC